MLHEGGYRIQRDYQGEHYFVRADGRAIPRCGYRVDDYVDDHRRTEPSTKVSQFSNADREYPSTEVREPRGVYRLSHERSAVAWRPT